MPPKSPASSSSSSFVTNVTLEFHEEIVQELMEKDSIAVIAEGLGIATILAMLIRKSHESELERIGCSADRLLALLDNGLRNEGEGLGDFQTTTRTAGNTDASNSIVASNHEKMKAKVVIIVGASETLRTATVREFERLYPERALDVPLDVTADVSMAIRKKNYERGTPCFVTSRIFAVDLLARRLPAEDVAGMIVANAHNVQDISGEGFCARLFREKRFYARYNGQAVRSFESVRRRRTIDEVFVRKKRHVLAKVSYEREELLRSARTERHRVETGNDRGYDENTTSNRSSHGPVHEGTQKERVRRCFRTYCAKRIIQIIRRDYFETARSSVEHRTEENETTRKRFTNVKKTCGVCFTLRCGDIFETFRDVKID